MTMKKFISHVVLAAVILTLYSGCSSKEKKSEAEIIDLIEKDAVKQISIVNKEYALITLKGESDQPKYKLDLKEHPHFRNKMRRLQNEYRFSMSSGSSLPLSATILFWLMPFLFLFYVIGGIICLIVALKNQFKNPIDKLVWVFTLVFVPVVGVILFIVIGRKQIQYSTEGNL